MTLEGAALPMVAEKKIIMICIVGQPCTGGSAHYFTVEARVKGLGSASQFDDAVPGEGVIIHRFEGDRSPSPVRASSTVRAGGPGRWMRQSFVDAATGLVVRVPSRSGSLLSVAVNPNDVLFADGFESGAVSCWSPGGCP